MEAPRSFPTYGAWLKSIRLKHKLTPKELALRMGYEVSYIRKLEAGRRKPTLKFHEQLVQVLEITDPDPALLTPIHVRLPLETVPDHSPVFARSYLPLRPNPLFTGRDALLQQIAQAFTTPKNQPTNLKTICLGQNVAATGLGGIGKTQLAVEFAHRYGSFYSGGVFWLNFAEPAGIPGEIARCGRAAHLNLSPDFDQLSQEQQVALVQSAWQENIPRLLIFDNCEDEKLLETWQPTTGGCHVLITSRCQDWDLTLGVTPLILEVLSRPESIFLLQYFIPTLSDTYADNIANQLGDLPLALHLAGNYLRETGLSPQEYLQQLDQQGRIQHPSLQTGRLSPTRHENNLANTFALILLRLDTDDPDDRLALALLRRAVCFSPGQPIPLEPLAATLPAQPSIDGALTRLLKLGLVTAGENQTIRIHQLIAEFAQEWQGNQANENEAQASAVQAVTETLLHHTEQGNYTRNLYPARDWQIHLRHITETSLRSDDVESVPLCQTLGWHLWLCGDYQEARHYLETALKIQRQSLSQDDPEIAVTLDRLGRTWQALSQYEKARICHEEALAVRQQANGPEHLLVAESHNSLGLICQALGNFPVARHHLQRAITIRCQLLGPAHSDTGFSYLCMAFQCNSEGEYEEAIAWTQKALEIAQGTYGENHPDTARVLNGLGLIYQNMGLYPDARQYYAQALEIRTEILGLEHNDTLTTLSNLSGLLRDMGQFTEAQKLMEQGLAIRKKKYGTVHLATGQSLHHLGVFFIETGAYEKALQTLEQTLEIFEAIFEPTHAELAFPLTNLGLLHHRLGHLAQASTYLQQALTLRLEKLGEHHLNTALTLTYLGDVHTELEEFTDAAAFLRRAYHSLVQAKFPHPRVMAQNLHAQGRLKEIVGEKELAESFYKQALTLRYQYLGSAHPHTRESVAALERVVGNKVKSGVDRKNIK